MKFNKKIQIVFSILFTAISITGLSVKAADVNYENSNSSYSSSQNGPDSQYTTDYSYSHGVKQDPSDRAANDLNSREFDRYKPTEEVTTETTVVKSDTGCNPNKSTGKM